MRCCAPLARRGWPRRFPLCMPRKAATSASVPYVTDPDPTPEHTNRRDHELQVFKEVLTDQ